jgi:HEAT repeat protein
LDPRDEEAVPALARLLAGEDRLARLAAAEVLTRLGPAGRAAAPALLKVWKEDEDRSARMAAGEALRQVDPEAARRAGVKE